MIGTMNTERTNTVIIGGRPGWTCDQLLPTSGRTGAYHPGAGARRGERLAESALGFVHTGNAQLPGADARSRVRWERPLRLHVTRRSDPILRRIRGEVRPARSLPSGSGQRGKEPTGISGSYERREI